MHGHEGVRDWWRGLGTAFPECQPSLTDVKAYGDFVVIRGHATGSGAASGVGIDDVFWQVVKLRDGLVVEYRAFRTEREALDSVGMGN